MSTSYAQKVALQIIASFGDDSDELSSIFMSLVNGDEASLDDEKKSKLLDFLKKKADWDNSVAEFLVRFLAQNKDKLVRLGHKDRVLPHGFYDGDGAPTLDKLIQQIQGPNYKDNSWKYDISANFNDIGFNQVDNTIRDTLPANKGPKRSCQFKKAWDRVSAYEDINKWWRMKNKLSQIRYGLWESGVVGISGIPWFDREWYMFTCENSDQDTVNETLGLAHLPSGDGFGIKPNTDREDNENTFYYDNPRAFANLDPFAWESYASLVKSDAKRCDFLPSIKDILNLLKWGEGDGLLLADLLGLPVNNSGGCSIWLSEMPDDKESICLTLHISPNGLCMMQPFDATCSHYVMREFHKPLPTAAGEKQDF
jgi:hypothetical protein